MRSIQNTEKTVVLTPNQYNVHPEYTINTGRRIDILMTDGKNYIAIENKPWANDQKEQLKDYGDWLQKSAKNDKNWLLIYLCNNDISDYTLPKETDISIKQNVVAVTFHELSDWLIDCVLYIQAQKVKLFVEDLIVFIQEKVNRKINMTLQNELNHVLLSKSSNIKSVLLIEKNIKGLKSVLFKKFINYINTQITDLKIEAELDSDIEKRWAGFHVAFNSNDRFILRWEFEQMNQRKLYFGIRRKNNTIEPNKEKYKKIIKATKNIFLGNSSFPWCPSYSYADKEGMPRDIDDDTWLEFYQPESSKFAKSVIKIIRSVYYNDELRSLLE